MQKHKLILLLVCVFMIGLTTASIVAQDDMLPAFGDLEAGVWSQIDAGGDTICSNGTPYSFFVRPADEPTDKLLIHFQGGGACWFGQNCDLTASPTYDPFVDQSDNPAGYGGIFDFENMENPFLDYDMVMVPYCTADVHIGNSDATYVYGEGDDAKEVTIHHNGYVNATTVLDWTFENVESPDTVFVTGCSAGSIPSPFYTQFVAENYPDARIEQLGDAAGGYRNPEASTLVFGTWGTDSILPDSYADYTINDMTFETFYTVSAALYPDISFSQYNTAGDNVQVGFLTLLQMSDFEFSDLLAANLADISATAGNFDAYTAWGSGHCITPTDDFYTYQVNGVRFLDWVAQLAAGEDVESVTCMDCEAEEFFEAE